MAVDILVEVETQPCTARVKLEVGRMDQSRWLASRVAFAWQIVAEEGVLVVPKDDKPSQEARDGYLCYFQWFSRELATSRYDLPSESHRHANIHDASHFEQVRRRTTFLLITLPLTTFHAPCLSWNVDHKVRDAFYPRQYDEFRTTKRH